MVSTHLKNISQIGSFPQVGVKIKNCWNHHPAKIVLVVQQIIPCRSMQCNQGYMDPVAGDQAKEVRVSRGASATTVNSCQDVKDKTYFYALLLLATPYNPIIDICFSTLNASRQVSQKNPTSAAAGFVAENQKHNPLKCKNIAIRDVSKFWFFPPHKKKNWKGWHKSPLLSESYMTLEPLPGPPGSPNTLGKSSSSSGKSSSICKVLAPSNRWWSPWDFWTLSTVCLNRWCKIWICSILYDIYLCAKTYLHSFANVYIHTYLYIHIHIYIHIYIYTCIYNIHCFLGCPYLAFMWQNDFTVPTTFTNFAWRLGEKKKIHISPPLWLEFWRRPRKQTATPASAQPWPQGVV